MTPALALVLVGCGTHGAPRSDNARVAQARTTVHANVPLSPRDPSDTRVVTLPELGSLGYRCSPDGQRVAMSLSGAPSPDTGASVTAEGDHRAHLPLRHLVRGPTATDSTRPGRYRKMTWRIILTSEPRTVVATVRLHFRLRPPPNLPGSPDCTVSTWTASGQTILHDHEWSNPPAWP